MFSLRSAVPSLVAVLLSVASAAGQPTAPARRLLADLTIGSESDARYVLSPGLQLAVRSDGSMYVLLPMEHVVRIYDPQGRFVREFGRKGAGPGEFESPVHIGWRGDTLWVSDPMQLRVTLFRPDGRVISTVHPSVRPTRVYGTSTASALLADGSALVAVVVPAELATTGVVTRTPVLRVGRDGTVRDTLFWHSVRNRSIRVTLPERRRFFLQQPWDDSPILAVAPNGESFVSVERSAASGREGVFTVTRFDAGGRRVYARAFRYVPQPIAGEWRRRFIRENVEALTELRPGLPAGLVERELGNGVYVPAAKPPVTAVVAGNDGTVWLRRESSEAATVWWQVLDVNGRAIANVSVPGELKILVARRDRVWGTLPDENDVPRLIRYAVHAPGPR